MRLHRMRFDIWLTLLIAFGISVGAVKIAEMILSETYENYAEEHTVADGDIGGKAGEDVFRAQSVADLLSHDTFTIVSPGIEYRNRGAGYYGNYYMNAVTLPSGERVAAVINMEAVQYEGDYYSSDHTLPVGRVVYEDLTFNEYFMNQIEFHEPLSRTDFYVDMLGAGGKVSQEDYTNSCTDVVQVVTIVVCFMGPALVSVAWWILGPTTIWKQKKKAMMKRLDSQGFTRNQTFVCAARCVGGLLRAARGRGLL